jgi:PTH1 family peptidyl-tRNA hydrolase
MKYLIVGLGNPDKEYFGTRHNIGYRVVDNYLNKLNIETGNSYKFETDRYAFRAETKYKGRQVILIEPTTYMNLSGKAVRYWLDKEKVPIENLFVVVDDLALELGTIRLRLKGSDGGHNGLKNIIELLNTTTFNRMRFGIGSDFRRGGQIDFVLGKLSEEQEAIVSPQVEKTYDIINSFILVGMDKTMNLYNKK